MSEEVQIGENETAGELHDRLMTQGAGLVVRTIQAIRDGSVEPKEQTAATSGEKGAPRLFREHCFVKWGQRAGEVHNHIRGLSPYPGAYSILKMDDAEKEIKLLRSALTHIPSDREAGNVWITEDGKMMVACTDFFIEILQLQPAGKKPMEASGFLRGSRAQKLSFSQNPERE